MTWRHLSISSQRSERDTTFWINDRKYGGYLFTESLFFFYCSVWVKMRWGCKSSSSSLPGFKWNTVCTVCETVSADMRERHRQICSTVCLLLLLSHCRSTVKKNKQLVNFLSYLTTYIRAVGLFLHQTSFINACIGHIFLRIRFKR